MNFGNNIERMGFEKGGWSIIKTEADGTIFMGKPSKPDALPDEAVWLIKKVTTSSGKDGSSTIYIQYAYPIGRCKWQNKESLTYKYL